MDANVTFLDQLFAVGLLIPTGVEGLYGRGAAFEDIVDGLEAMITRAGRADGAERVRFPPAMPRTHFEEGEYLKSFPQLAGTIHCFNGDERGQRRILKQIADGEDWTGGQVASEMVLAPAACYPAYPLIASRGRLPEGGKVMDVMSWCFRHEPSPQPTRMQMFRMREFLWLGAADWADALREDWFARARQMAETLRLPYTIEVAHDPFFGRAGQLMVESQRAQELKFELLIPVNSATEPTACMSFNSHLEHFGELWNIKQHDGSVANTGCVAFGLERLALALVREHGLDVEAWPADVRAALGL